MRCGRCSPGSLEADLDEVLRSATAVFAGYLVLDALIANTDPHHENWAVINAASGRAWLAPSFDHATSLGFQEAEDRKGAMLGDRAALERWVARGSSNHFEGKPGLVQLALAALDRCTAEVRQFWLDRLGAFERDQWAAAIQRVPGELMSQADRRPRRATGTAVPPSCRVPGSRARVPVE